MPIPVTIRIIIPESGSRRNPQGTDKLPIEPSLSCSGIADSQSATVTSKARSAAGSCSSCQKATPDNTSASPIVVQATKPAAWREK